MTDSPQRTSQRTSRFHDRWPETADKQQTVQANPQVSPTDIQRTQRTDPAADIRPPALKAGAVPPGAFRPPTDDHRK